MKVLVIGARWCVPCLVMRAKWEEVGRENRWLEVEYIDYDKDKEVIEEYGVDKDIPVFVFVNGQGREFQRMQGEVAKQELIDFIKANRDN